MQQETPDTPHEELAPFDADGCFDPRMASGIALELRASGNLDAAEALEQMAAFFRTSEDYIFDDVGSAPPSGPSSSNAFEAGVI